MFVQLLVTLFFVLWGAGCLVAMLVFSEGIEKRFTRKKLKRLDIVKMIIFFPATIIVTFLIVAGSLVGKFLSAKTVRKIWHWLNMPVKEDKNDTFKW